MARIRRASPLPAWISWREAEARRQAPVPHLVTTPSIPPLLLLDLLAGGVGLLLKGLTLEFPALARLPGLLHCSSDHPQLSLPGLLHWTGSSLRAGPGAVLITDVSPGLLSPGPPHSKSSISVVECLNEEVQGWP